MAQQTGSISFEAVGGFSSYASGQFTTTEDVAQMSQPNLSPYFSHPMSDVWDATENPDGYWKRITTSVQFTTYDMQVEHDGSGGWAHFAGNVTSGNPFVRFEPMPIVTIKPSTKYTFVVDVDTVDAASTITRMTLTLFSGSAQSDCIDPFSTTGSLAVLGRTGTYYVSGTTKASISNVTGLCRSYLQVYGTGTFDVYLRVSLYEGEYSGPYKPYVDQSLITRVSTAETAIEQNAENILLRATKTEAQQLAQPNLAPITAAPLDSVYNATTNPNGYWKTTPASWFTSLEDGWVHVERDNTEGTGAANTVAWRPRPAEGIVAGGVYTILTEIRNNHSTVSTVGSYDIYLQQQANNQFWGNVEQIVPGSPDDGTSTTTTVPIGKCGESYVLRSYRLADAEHLSGDPSELFRYNFRLPAGCKFDFDIRQSVYEGIYEGPYKPYSGTQLYASQAQLKVANDEIDLRVEKSGVIAAINASTEAEGGSAVKISADKVQIDGTTTFTSGTTLADYVEGKAQDAADSVVVGGRNLLRSSGVWEQGTWNTSTGAHIASTTRLRSSKDGWYVPVEPNATYVIGRHAVDSSVDYHVVLYAYDSSGAYVLTDSVTTWITSFPYTYVPATATRLEVGIRRSDNANISVSEAAAARLKLERGNKATDWSPAPEDVTSRTQRIYYRTSSSTAPTSQYMPTAWVTETGDKWAANSTTVANWTAKATKLTNGTTKYPYLFTCEQRQMGDGTLAYTTVLLDETTTVIDGGSIITNSIDANKLTVYDATIGKIKADAIDVSSIKIGDLDGASTVVSNAANGKSAYDRHTAYRGTCSTAAGTAAKVVACTGFALATGATVEVYCSTANTANVPTLNVNSTGAKAVWINGAVASASNPCKWLAGDTVTFTYDGTRFRASLPVEGYVTEGTGGGLMVHRKSDATTGVQITDSVEILQNGNVMTRVDENGMTLYDGSGTADANVVASFGEDLIELGKGSEDAVIKLCNGVATMSVENFEFIFRRVGGYLTLKTVPSANAATYSRIQLDSGTLSLETYSENEDLHAAVNVTSLSGHDPRVQIRGILELDTPLADAYIDSVSTSKLNGTIPTSKLDGTIATSKLDGTIADANLPTKGSAGTAGTSSATSGATLAVPYVTTDAYGRVTAKGTHTHTIGSLAASAVTTGEFDAARIPNLDASKINAGTFDAARIPSLNASKINAGTFNAARIPNLNASKINAGTLASARLPTVPVDKGGTGQTGVEKSTDIAAAMSAASGVTISAAQVATWGKVMQVLITAKATAAKSGTWTVGTMTAGHRPELVTFGTSNLAAIEQCRMGTDGAVSVAGTLAANASVSLSFTYLLA